MSKSSPLKVVGYIRVSTNEQSTEGVSLAAQRAKIEAFAALHDLDLVGIHEDAGVSAKTLDRPALSRVLRMLRSGEAGGLVVAKLDRLSRSVRDWNILIDDHFGPTGGRQLFSVADSIDTRTAAGRLVLNVLMSVAQWEREAISERTKDALAHKRSMGERIGAIPFGRSLDDDRRTLRDDPAELATLAMMGRWHVEGQSYRAIARELNERNIPAKGGGRWGHVTVKRAVDALGQDGLLQRCAS